MVKLRIKTAAVGCQKPGCKRRLDIPHRHHRRCETLFIHAFGRDKRNKSEKFIELRDRYSLFREEDTIQICGWHHAEIHLIYDDIIRQDTYKRLRSLDRYSWKQANSLMDKLRQACLEWEKEKTPGVDPTTVFKEKPRLNATYV